MSEWKDENSELHRIYAEKGPRAMLIHLLEANPEAYSSLTIDGYRRLCRMHFGNNPEMSALLGLAVIAMWREGMEKEIADFAIENAEQLWEKEREEAALRKEFPTAKW